MTNNIVIAGRLVADAELFFTNNGSAVCNFTLANNKRYKDIEKSTFIEASIFGNYAESMNKYLKKGVSIDVIGELVQESWNKDGKIYYKHKIKVKEIDFRTPKDNISEANFENEEETNNE
ncbi:TPA: single-stranded DNA-binding protein [Campylobacter fetus]|uniref:single-stranded DNA-binding protein n=1 Tax=Campylobacter fetus TaxID=196 RepID=UPI0005090343|nr:single-stranded DNA-binding protein [Campylobacter fetus]AIR79653.1 single-stranded DNA binding protein [Campylobacter fetus subsp. fetus 04/554]EMC8631864.1 single-stranded DNA-binding protein [Campylobacter fetus]HDX6328376.1 single-stranded DNA-binding protein [Campylobacter fetus]